MKLTTAILVIICAYCMPSHASTDSKNDSAKRIAGQVNAFACDLYRELYEDDGNLLCSPYSISTALSMVYAGAKGNTAQEMATVLHFSLPPEQLCTEYAHLQNRLEEQGAKNDFELLIAHALWIQKGYSLLKGYRNLLQNAYSAGPRVVNFAEKPENARVTINRWVEKKTEKKIRNLLKRGMIDSLTRLIVANAIYFRGQWAHSFNEKKTTEEPFTLLNGKKIDVSMMYQRGKYGYGREKGMQIVEIPYTDNVISMRILLPDSPEKLRHLERTLTAKAMAGWTGKLKRREVKLYLPRFTFSSEFNLARHLHTMGMDAPFSLPPADFSGISGKKDLAISAVVHKAFVEVNEKGTEAAAATAVGMRATSAKPAKLVIFRADHPFIFTIQDNETGVILFIGRVVNPSQNQ